MLDTARRKTEPVTRFVRGRLYRLKLRLRSIGADVVRIAKLLGAIAAVVVAIEVAATIAFAVAHRNDPAGDPRARSDAHGNAAWTARHYDDLHALAATARWDPDGARLGPFDSPTIHVDETGARRTWSAPAPVATSSTAAAASAARVLVLGGSEVFGAAARDDETVPSRLARALARRRDEVGAVVVENRGAIGRTERESVALLERELRDGRKPDLAVFCCGWEDLLAACANGRAGLPIDARRREVELGLSTSRGRLAWCWLGRTATESSTARALGSAREMLFGKRGAVVEADAAERLAADIIGEHARNVAHVRKLEAAYGFAALWYAQPTLYAKAARSGGEERVLGRDLDEVPCARPTDLRPIVDALAARRDREVRDLADLFAKDGEPRFVDVADLAEAGNVVVAERIAADVVALRAKK